MSPEKLQKLKRAVVQLPQVVKTAQANAKSGGGGTLGTPTPDSRACDTRKKNPISPEKNNHAIYKGLESSVPSVPRQISTVRQQGPFPPKQPPPDELRNHLFVRASDLSGHAQYWTAVAGSSEPMRWDDEHGTFLFV